MNPEKIVELSPGGEPTVVGRGGEGKTEQVHVPLPALPTLPAPPKRSLLLALLFASPDALSPTRLAEAAGFTLPELRETLEELRSWIEREGAPFRVEELGGRYRLLSLPEYELWIRRLEGVRRQDRLSQPAFETLAIVAYRQPIIKAEVEAIRGVQAGPVLRALIERKLVRVAGRAKVPGRPLQYGTTQTFLDRFGLKSLEDLPTVEELKQS